VDRPLLCCCRDITERHRRLAEIIEMIHTASLVHDDVLDDCSTRRGEDNDDLAAGWEQQIIRSKFAVPNVL